jgi:hypothetical protein
MKNFVVLFKAIDVPMNFDSKHLSADYFQLDYLFSEASKRETGKWVDIRENYVIDEKSVSFQTIGGKLCVAMIAYRK